MKLKALFVCSANVDRSPVAERMFSNWKGRWETKSAGISPFARHPIGKEDGDWADIILVMEPHQKEYIINKFMCSSDKVHSLDIEDKYNIDNPTKLAELKEDLLEKVAPILDAEDRSRG